MCLIFWEWMLNMMFWKKTIPTTNKDVLSALNFLCTRNRHSHYSFALLFLINTVCPYQQGNKSTIYWLTELLVKFNIVYFIFLVIIYSMIQMLINIFFWQVMVTSTRVYLMIWSSPVNIPAITILVRASKYFWQIQCIHKQLIKFC